MEEYIEKLYVYVCQNSGTMNLSDIAKSGIPRPSGGDPKGKTKTREPPEKQDLSGHLFANIIFHKHQK